MSIHSIPTRLVRLSALAVLLAAGAGHASGESLSERLKARAGSELAGTSSGTSSSTAAPQRSNGAASQALKGLTGQSSSGSAATTTQPAGGAASLLGGGTAGALGGSALGASALGGLGLPSLAGGSAGNVAGVLEYCVKNNYLKQANASAIKDRLLGKAGLSSTQPEQDGGYASGLGGVLSGGDGKSFNLSSIQDNVKEKACDYVLENASSLL
ncbi:DUF2501 domain-containing protein [Corticibacter populi]|uniref:DUF2501 domain-containing protein n=1 Tax=Corticibacter populi TaxID=1550736 RepID=A0A3M6QY74_9BURK|nr:DUF2501 domain-containing protein [Corticibacter populi]RMX07823.1 DUF2501 domain-containing protein [Corticibacter populi]RZS35056.1 uncharacterized protein DUF2501 [Corticibacter populi]